MEVPPFSPSAVFTEWGLSPVLFVLLVWATGLYLYGVWLLHDRGDRWPIGRTLAFVVGGMGSFWFATMSGLAAYDETLLSVHMVQHMILSMAVPLFCALGAPVTLALRTLPQRSRKVLFIVDMALVADAQHGVLAHRVLDRLDQLCGRFGSVGADQLGSEQGMELVDLHWGPRAGLSVSVVGERRHASH